MATARVRRVAMCLAVAMAGAALAAGCASGGGGSSSAYDLAYTGGRYAEARQIAEREYARSAGRQRVRAALKAGLAAHAMGDDAGALHRLGPITSDRDPAVAGRALATVGLVHYRAGDYAKASGRLMEAGRKLGGDEGARSWLFAGDSLAAMGQSAQARVQYSLAAASARDPALKETIRSRTAGGVASGAYTVQIGAFSQRTNAEQAAAEVRGRAAAAGLGEPRIVGDVGGRSLYLVQVGSFPSKQAAAAARSQLGVEGVVATVFGP